MAEKDRVSQLEEILESIKDAVLRIDEDLKVSHMNQAACVLFKSYDWRGMSIADVAQMPGFVEFLSRQNKGDDSSSEFELTRGPHTRHILARISLQDDGGQVAVLRDVTTVRRLERMRRDFVANVSHELKTPISVVSANAETLLDGAMQDPPIAARLIDAVHRNAERLSVIVNDLLDLSRLEAGSYSLLSGRISLAQVAQRVAESLEEKRSQNNSQISIEIDPDFYVMTDEAAIFQVLVNYMENAIKYTPAGSTIQVVAERRNQKIRTLVRDNGPGIPSKYQNRVFERFFRIDPGRSREMGGTGLGLSIVKHLVEAMGGRVGVEPVEPSGSAFWLELPSALARNTKLNRE